VQVPVRVQGLVQAQAQRLARVQGLLLVLLAVLLAGQAWFLPAFLSNKYDFCMAEGNGNTHKCNKRMIYTTFSLILA